MNLYRNLIPVAFIFMMLSDAAAQSFVKGDMIINAGIKISIYGVKNDNEDDDGERDLAASYTIPVGFEYAISNKFSFGAEVGFCKYFTEEDSITRAIASAGSFDFLLKGNYYWVKGGSVNFSSGIGMGISSFHYESNDYLDSQFKSTGFYFRISLVDFKVYFSKNIGLSGFFGVPLMNFQNGRITDNLGSDFSYPLSFNGFDIGTGLVVKF